MTTTLRKVLVIGATGSVGRLVVAQLLTGGQEVVAVTRKAANAKYFPREVTWVVGDISQQATLRVALDGVDAVVFTHGSDGGGKAGSERVDYGAVRNILQVLGDRKIRIALMTAIGVTNRGGSYNRSTEAHDWKRRAERLVRHSGCEYTIVRPGWFDYQEADQHRLVFLQGDRRHAGSPADGVVARQQIAEVLVASLSSEAANRKTFELVAERGPAPANLEQLFAGIEADPDGSLDAVHDMENMPLEAEPDRVRADFVSLAAISSY